jgi:methionyl aminopeptidase
MHSIFTDEKDLQGMREAGRLASEVLDYITPFIKPGVSTGELDRLCHAYMKDVQKTIPAPLNYQPPGYPPFPAAICTSVNDVICHGIPGDKVLKNGDVVNLDITVITVMSRLTTSPFLSTLSPGMPWQMTSFTEVQMAAGKGG